VLDQPQDEVGGRHCGLHSEQLEVLEVAWIIDARDYPAHGVLLLRHLADDDVVLVVAGDRDHQIGALDSRPLQHPELCGVTVLDDVLEFLLDNLVATMVGLEQGHLLVVGQQLAREVPTHLAGSDDDHVHGPLSP
jgi:hypothetical protein